jgi:hypothetical protein
MQILKIFDKTARFLSAVNPHMFATYDLVRNTRLGLDIKMKKLPFLRIYRRDDESHYSERATSDFRKGVLHFVIDHSSEDIRLPDDFEAYFAEL